MLRCMLCNKTPEQIPEYKSYARMEEVTPEEFVRENEPIGCWGPHSRDKFYCTNCYVKAGMPSRR